MRFFKRKKRTKELEKMEQKLDAVLYPVEPRHEYIRDLRERLMTRFAIEVPNSAVETNTETSHGWLVAGGVVGTILMLITSARGLLSIAGLIGLLLRYINQRKQEPASQMAH